MTSRSSSGSRGPRCAVGILRVVYLALLSTVAGGCAKVLGVDDYENGPGSGGSEAPDGATVSLPLLPAIPDSDHVATCTACVKDQCSDLRATCVGSPRCRAMLACQGRCRDPACLVACADALPRSFDFEALFACAYGTGCDCVSKCKEECGAGVNWECSGRYRWPFRDPKTISVAVHLTTFGLAGSGPLSYPKGVDIAPCNDLFLTGPSRSDFGCGAWVPVGDYGNVRVPLGPAESVFSLRGRERHRIYPRPIAQDGPLELSVDSLLPDNAFVYTLSLIGGFDPKLGTLTAYHFDCLGQMASSMISLVPTGSAHRFYLGGVPTADQPGPAPGFYNVSPGPAVVEAVADGAPPSQRPVVVAPGALTTVYLYPAE